MKKSFSIFIAVTAISIRAALPQPDLIAQIHFAGGQKISASANFSAFTDEFSSPEALALRTQTADKSAAALSSWLQNKLGVTAPNGAAKLRPLFDDLQNSEWFLEARLATDGRPEVAIAIKLDAAHEKIWRANLAPFFAATPRHAQFKSANGWLFFECGFDAPKLSDALAQKISASDANWLAADINWPLVARWFPQLKDFNLPETQFTISAPDKELRVAGKFFFAQNQTVVMEPWRMPTNTIRQPFVSFTAARGLSSWLDAQSWAAPYKLSPEPNQVFIWALPQIPFQTFVAVPVPDSAAALKQMGARLQPVFDAANERNDFLMPIHLEKTNDQITFVGAPFVAPYVRTLNESAGQFLLAGFFPNPGKPKPLPSELFTRLAEKNLVYYHWEITAERLPQMLNLSQLGLVLTSRKQLDASSAAFKWVQKIGPELGNTVTEIFQTAPDQFTFSRKAPGGLTAFELFALANWLEAANFPGCDLKLPPRATRFKMLHPKTSTSDAAPAPH